MLELMRVSEAKIQLSAPLILSLIREKKKALKKRKRIEAKFAEAKKHYSMTRGGIICVLRLWNLSRLKDLI